MVGVGVLLASGITSVIEAEGADALVTQKLVTEESLPDLSASLANEGHPSGSEKVVLVPDGDDQLIAQASVLAATMDAAVLVSPSGSDPGMINTWLGSLGATSVYLFGAEGSFTSEFRSNLTSTVVVSQEIASSSPFERSVAAANLIEQRPSVVSGVGTLADATAFAIAARTPLILTNGTETDASISSFFESRSEQMVTVAGGLESFDVSLLPTQLAESIGYLRTDSLKESFWKAAVQAVAGGADGTETIVAVGDSISNISVSALAASTSGRTFIAAGTSASFASESAAHEYLAAWGPELKSVTLAGVQVTGTMLESLASAARVTRATATGWHVKDLQVVGTDSLYRLVSVAGAATYEAWNTDLLGSSTSADISIPSSAGVPTYFIAKDSAGTELDTLVFRQNEFGDANSGATALSGSVRAGYHHLKWQSTESVPRLVSRIMVDPFADDPFNPPGDPERREVVAITCGTEYFDGPADKTKQWIYQVDVMSSSGRSCDQVDSGLVDLPRSVVTLPATELPDWSQYSRSSSPDSLAARPGYTVADTIIARSMSTSESSAGALSRSSEDPQVVRGSATTDSTARNSAESGSALVLIYETYIPEPMIAVPGFTGDWAKPIIAFHGDGRAWYSLDGGMENNKARTLLNQFFTFGSTHTGSLYKKIGETLKYKCADMALQNCTQTDSASAPLDSISGTFASYPNSATATMVVDSTIPLFPAPAINGTMEWNIRQGGSSVVGTHDRMPVHQLWYGAYASQAYLIYRNDFYNPVCLSGFPRFICKAVVNAQF